MFGLNSGRMTEPYVVMGVDTQQSGWGRPWVLAEADDYYEANQMMSDMRKDSRYRGLSVKKASEVR